MRVFLSAFGQPGHAFPMFALGERLAQRGHQVTIETWQRFSSYAADTGIAFVAAPEYPVFPTRERPLQPYQAVVRAVPATRAAIRASEPDVVVHDILTLAPALAAELEGVAVVTLIPHLYPIPDQGMPPFASGALPPRTAIGRGLWSALSRPLEAGARLGREQLNETRRRIGLGPCASLYGGISSALCLVATFPQLEYPRSWPAPVHVTGPLLWTPPVHASGIPTTTASPARRPGRPNGGPPLVVVAPTTSHDPQQRLLRAALDGLRHLDVRLLGVTNRRALPAATRAARSTRVVSWLDYPSALSEAALVICHAGHGTVAHALARGVPVLAVPHSGDMAENAARIAWAGVGVRLPWRLLTPSTLRLATCRALADRGSADTGGPVIRARELARWAEANDGAERAAELIESSCC